ncbi:MAG: hypothetical protein IJ313_07575 [Clostridia bacterium]|nr:hypothetical protein [Clostridia bacterium]
MRRWMILWVLLLLPVQGLTVAENVVEPAPNVKIEMGALTDALFGAWEQGLSDIRAAARNAAISWKQEEPALSLKEITLRNSPMDNDPDNDEITVTFLYTEDGIRRRLHVDYLRGTGEVTGLSDVRDNSIVQRECAAPGDASLTDAQLEEIAKASLIKHYGETSPKLKEIVESASEDNWFARFEVERGIYEVVLDRRTGGMPRASLSITP